jgi:hypothetical protein
LYVTCAARRVGRWRRDYERFPQAMFTVVEPVVRDDGTFQFDRLPAGPYEIRTEPGAGAVVNASLRRFLC